VTELLRLFIGSCALLAAGGLSFLIGRLIFPQTFYTHGLRLTAGVLVLVGGAAFMLLAHLIGQAVLR
jgi:hypothetical protein